MKILNFHKKNLKLSKNSFIWPFFIEFKQKIYKNQTNFCHCNKMLYHRCLFTYSYNLQYFIPENLSNFVKKIRHRFVENQNMLEFCEFYIRVQEGKLIRLAYLM